MGDHSAIEWTDATWNPLAGCTRVSAGCDNCYAATQVAGRLKNRRQYKGLAVITPSGRAAFNGKIRLLPERLEQPLAWRKPRRIFVNSMSDLFHESVTRSYIDDVFAVMALASQHTFQVLTKRPERMMDYLDTRGDVPMSEIVEARVGRRATQIARERGEDVDAPNWDIWWDWPLPNVWLGTSCENQEAADERILPLMQTPAAVRFISAEPLLGPIRFSRHHQHCSTHDFASGFCGGCRDTRFLDWVIVGGESGRGARPMDLGWVHEIVEQCQAAGPPVPVFVKQLGAVPMMAEEIWDVEPMTKLLSARNRNRVPEGFVPLKFDDPKGGDWEEWPPELRVREYPKRVTERVTPADAVTPEGV